MKTINVEIKTEKERDNLIKQLQEMEFKKEVKSWEDLEEIKGWEICCDTDDVVSIGYVSTSKYNQMVWATEEQAKASIAMAQLSQLMKYYNGDWVPDWSDDHTNKYTIEYFEYEIALNYYQNAQKFLSFPTEEKRDTFLKNHIDLIEQAKPLL